MVKRRSTIIAVAAIVVLLAVAGVLLYNIENSSPLNKLSDELYKHGYYFHYSDFYPAEEYKNTTLRSLLAPIGGEAEAVEASRHAGFPSDIDKVGNIVLMLANIDDDSVVTIFLIDGEIELCFIQTIESGEIKSIDEADTADN